MKVLCTINNILEIEDSVTLDRIQRYIHLSDGQTNLKINVEYCVYGILIRDNAPWYYLCLDERDKSPTPYPTELFRITDERLSSYWRLSTKNSTKGVMSSMVFDEWAKDPSFYERLIDDDSSAIELFKNYQNLMNNE